MDTADKVSVNLLLADILSFVNDESMREHGFNKGYYISGVQKAVEELGYDTFFDVQTTDLLLKEENKKNLAVMMPTNCFNIREMYLFKCTCKDGETQEDASHGCCSPASSVIVHWKRLYNNAGKGDGYTAKRVDRGRDQRDAFFNVDGDVSTLSVPPTNLHYGNVQNGMIMLSINARAFTHLRLVYNGSGGNIGDEPVIPRFLRTAVVDYVTERTLRTLAARDPGRWRLLWSDTFARLTDDRNGSWIKAERRIKMLDTWKRDSTREYTGRMNF